MDFKYLFKFILLKGYTLPEIIWPSKNFAIIIQIDIIFSQTFTFIYENDEFYYF